MNKFLSQLSLVGAIGLLLAITACSEQDTPASSGNSGNDNNVIATIDHKEIDAKGGGFILRINVTGNWTAWSSEEWCTLSRTSGSGVGSVSGYIEPNGENERVVKISVETEEKSVTFSITQKGKDTGGTEAQKYAGRIEMPAPAKEGNNLFITHSTQYKGKETITYSLEYNCEKKSARWVAFTFDRETCQSNTSRSDAWAVDPFIPSNFQTTYNDYKNSKYSRGHLCASSDRLYSYEANTQTFMMSNINPQIQNGFNGGIWQQLEEQVQAWGKVGQASDTLYVVKGGTIDDGQINEYINNNIPVPQYFYMAVLNLHNGFYDAIGFWLEHKAYNNNDSYKNYALSIDELESKTGLDFFHNLPDKIENEIEASYDTDNWNWKK